MFLYRRKMCFDVDVVELHCTGSVSTFVGGGTLGTVAGFTDGTGSDVTFNSPTGLAIDSLGIIYVADTGNYIVRRITPSG